MLNLSNVSTAVLVNEVLDALMEHQEGHQVFLDAQLDPCQLDSATFASYQDGVGDFTLRGAIRELNKRHTHMPISDLIREEARRAGK
ncbi:MAG: hypothetical protein IT435_02630 [Phycisphaerales bacterium]|nr:hypothetical protein [Phycisphaerales bacterium]